MYFITIKIFKNIYSPFHKIAIPLNFLFQVEKTQFLLIIFREYDF